MTGVEFHDMRVDGVPGRHVVAKVGRVSSPPVAADAVTDPRAAALARLADVLRGGPHTRAYSDFVAFKRQREDPDPEWAGYATAVCHALGCDRLAPFHLDPLPPAEGLGLPVTYHAVGMNDRPYVVARVGPVLGGPAAVLLLGDPAASALERLADVLRAGPRGRCFADLLGGRAAGEASAHWARYGRSVAGELAVRGGRGPGPGEWVDTRVRAGGLYRYAAPSPLDAVRPAASLSAGGVVRVLGRGPTGTAAVRVGDPETGEELGVVDASALRPV